MDDKCILNLETALRETGLSDEMVSECTSTFNANKERLFGMDDTSVLNEINRTIADVKKHAEMKRTLQLRQAERVLEYSGRFQQYMDAGINPQYFLTDIIDGSLNTGATESMRGYSTRMRSLEDRLRANFVDRLTEAGGVDADGRPVTYYSDAWRKQLVSPDEQTQLDFLTELGYYQNEQLRAAKSPEYSDAIPAPGSTGNKDAQVFAEVFSQMQDEHRKVMQMLGIDTGTINKFYLPQKWFGELMEPGWLAIQEARFKGIKDTNGNLLKGNKAEVELRKQFKEQWVQDVLDNIDTEQTVKNIRHYRYARHKSDLDKVAKALSDMQETMPTTYKLLNRSLETPPFSDDKGGLAGMSAIFGKHFESVRYQVSNKSNLRAVKEIAEGNWDNKFTQEQIKAAKELVNNPDTIQNIKNLWVPDTDAVDLPQVIGEIYDGIIRPSEVSAYTPLGSSKAQQLLQNRILQFKDAPAYHYMQSKYGFNNAFQHAQSSLSQMAQDQVSVDMFAGNIHNTLLKTVQTIQKDVEKQLDLANTTGDAGKIMKLGKVLKDIPRLQDRANLYADWIAGKYNRRSESAVNRILTGMMQVGRLALGQSAIAAFGDATIRTEALGRVLQGHKELGIRVDNPFTNIMKIVGTMMDDTFNTGFLRDREARVHAFVGSMKGHANRMSPFGQTEMSNAQGDIIYRARQAGRKFMDWYMTATMSNQFDEAAKSSVADMMSTYLAAVHQKGVKYNDKVFAPQKQLLQQAGISEAEWNIIAKRGLFKYGKNLENSAISVRELEKNIKDSDILKLIDDVEGEVNPMQLLRAKRDLISKYDEFLVGIASSAVVTPNIETTVMLKTFNGGLDPTSGVGAVAQLFTEFLSYPMRVVFDLHRSFVVDWSRNGVQSLGPSAIRAGKLLAAAYIYGYTAFAIKSFINQQEIPDPTNPKTIERALRMGGALGLTGELAIDLFSQNSLRELGAFLGPTGSRIVDAADLLLGVPRGTTNSKKVLDYAFKANPNLFAFNTIMDKVFAGSIYQLFGAEYNPDEKLNKWKERYGTFSLDNKFDFFK